MSSLKMTQVHYLIKITLFIYVSMFFLFYDVILSFLYFFNKILKKKHFLSLFYLTIAIINNYNPNIEGGDL